MESETRQGEFMASDVLTTNKKGKNIWGYLFVAVIMFLLGYGINQWQLLPFQGKTFNRVIFDSSSLNNNSSEVKLDLDNFQRVLDLISENYLATEAIDPERLVDGAIKGMVSALGDPYTSYYSEEDNTSFKDDLEGLYEGIGAQLGFRDEQIVIIAPLNGSPAEQAGILAGDAILAVDDQSVAGWGLEATVAAIRGAAGSSVKVTLSRGDGEPFDLEIQRAQIRIQAVRLTWLEGDIAHVRVLRFGSDTNSEWDKVVKEIKSRNAAGVVLDVRNNPGGLLDSAIYLVSEFFNDGVVVKRESKSETIDYRVDHKCRLCELPVVALINGGSASASEILAGALQARGRAQLVGEKSFGKGTVQEAIDLSGGAAVHITTARWLLPNGSNIHGVGLIPDIEVLVDKDTSPFGDETDAQLQKAVEIITQ